MSYSNRVSVTNQIRRITALLALLSGLALLVSTPTLAQDTIRLANGEWKPFQSEGLPHYGPYSEIATKAFGKVGIDVEYGFFPWKRALRLVEIGDWDASFFWVSTNERRNKFVLSEPVFSKREVIFYARDNPIDARSVNDFMGLVMGRLDGSEFGGQFQELIDRGDIHVIYARDNQSLFMLLARKRVDFIPELLKSGYDAIDSLPEADDSKNLIHTESLPFDWSYHMLFSKETIDNHRFVDAFNRGFALLRESGELDTILAPILLPNRDQ